MVYKKYNINKSTNPIDSKCVGESLPLSRSVSLKKQKVEGSRQIWIVAVPLIDVLIINISLALCYAVDVSGHVIRPLPYMPTISELGTRPPTSYIFTFGMTSSSLTTFLLTFFRYKQVSFSRDDCTNSMSVCAGYLSALSKLLLGAFQYHPDFKWLHYSSFISYIFFSYAYILTQVFLTYHTKTTLSTLLVLVRLIIAMLLVVFGALFCAIKLPRFAKLNEPPYNVLQLAQWTYWSLLHTYTLTFMVDFTRIRVSWNIRTSHLPLMTSSIKDGTDSDDCSHELYSGDSDGSSFRNHVDGNSFRNHVIIGRNGSERCQMFGIPPELTTKV